MGSLLFQFNDTCLTLIGQSLNRLIVINILKCSVSLVSFLTSNSLPKKQSENLHIDSTLLYYSCGEER